MLHLKAEMSRGHLLRVLDDAFDGPLDTGGIEFELIDRRRLPVDLEMGPLIPGDIRVFLFHIGHLAVGFSQAVVGVGDIPGIDQVGHPAGLICALMADVADELQLIPGETEMADAQRAGGADHHQRSIETGIDDGGFKGPLVGTEQDGLVIAVAVGVHQPVGAALFRATGEKQNE